VGNGLGADFEVGVIDASSTDLAAGETITLNISVVDQNGDAYTRGAIGVSFSSNCVSQQISQFSNPSERTTSGFVSTRYTPNGCSGEDVITARVDDADFGFDPTDPNRNNFVLIAQIALNIAQDSVAAVDFLRPGEDSSGLPSGTLDGFNTTLAPPGANGSRTSEVTFRLVGTQGAAVIGETVTFDVTNTVGGVRIAPGRETDTSDLFGLVRTVVQSGTVSTSFAVQATHGASGNSTLSDTMVVTGNIPINNRFALAQSAFVIDGFNTDGVEVDFSVIASDQFGNDIPDGTQIFFASPESGNIDSACQVVSGECSVTWRSAGVRPADGRATIIAYTDGAEDFTDFNGNNVFDDAGGDIPGLDLTEPFVDENENGVYDPGEFFVDVNLNESWDTGNGEWDGPCLDQISANANCDGEDSVTIFKTRVIAMPANNAVRFGAIEITSDGVTTVVSDFNAPAPTIDLRGGMTARVVVTALDGNTFADTSPPAPGTTIEAELVGTGASGGEVSGNITVGDNIQAEPFDAIIQVSDRDAATNAGPARVDITLTPPVGGNSVTYSFNVEL
jgi:hypothetical protein